MRVLWCGDTPTVPTGFAACTRVVCDELYRQGHNVTVLGINEWGGPHSYPYDIYPSVTPLEQCHQWDGSDRLPRLIHKLQPDIVVLLNDPWNVPGYLKCLEEYSNTLAKRDGVPLSIPPIVGWMAVDGKNQQHARVLNGLSHVAVWTQFAVDELKLAGYDGGLSIVPLGVDSRVFRPNSKSEARKRMLPDSIPADAFIVGVVGRNQPRKRLDLTIEYFARWIHDYDIPNAYLYLHVAPTGEQGTDIRSLCQYYHLSGKVIQSQVGVGNGLSDNDMCSTFNMFDVLLTTTQGEGWGLPVLEAMACSVPCIVPDWSALGCWTQAAAVRIPCTATATTAPLNRLAYTLGGIPDRDSTVAALDSLYRHPERRADLASRGRCLAEQLTWDSTGRMMVEVLNRVYDSER